MKLEREVEEEEKKQLEVIKYEKLSGEMSARRNAIRFDV